MTTADFSTSSTSCFNSCPTGSHSFPRVSYLYDPEVGNYNYGPGHPMKPHRIRMTQSLITHYGLYSKLQIHRPPRASFQDITRFHADEYINFLRAVSPSTMLAEWGNSKLAKYNVGDDCPVFEGVYEFCQISAGGSIAGAVSLNHGQADAAINWAGGLHHAKKVEASGFCYVNDIVLAILELLKYHARVLYIDIDVHHGDGVEEAFYTTDRVMTVSFHKYGEFFPGTGHLKDVGYGKGKNYAVNVPLRDGIGDEGYERIFRPVISHVMEWYRPSAVVLQCGSDSLAGDRLGNFNLSSKGHAKCVEIVKAYGLPTLYLGGGGYTIRNVARCWAYETAVVLGVEKELPEAIPFNDYFDYYGPDYMLTVPANNMQDFNTPEYLDKVLQRIRENLRNCQHAPNAGMMERPDDFFGADAAANNSYFESSGGESSDDEANVEHDSGDELLLIGKRVERIRRIGKLEGCRPEEQQTLLHREEKDLRAVNENIADLQAMQE